MFLLIASAVMLTAMSIIERSLNTQQFYSGWLMLLLLTILLLFYLKKKLSILPIGKNASWAQWHYYLGLFFLVAFLQHIEFEFPNGNLETAMAILLCVVIVTGTVGGLVNRLFARRLSYLKEEVIYERIPQHREAIKTEVEALMLDVAKQSGSDTLSQYYVAHLQRFFSLPDNFLTHVFDSDYSVLRIQGGLEQQLRYLNKYEASAALKLSGLIAKKDLLDRHYALQAVLKYWGVFHMPIGIVLLMLVIVHVVLVYAFKGAL